VGGAEQVLAALDAALVRAGHRSIVVACEGSSIVGELVPTMEAPSGVIGEHERVRAQAATRAAIARVLRRERVDVVHMHGLDFGAYLPPPGPPVLATLHLPLEWYSAAALRTSRSNTWLHCVSPSQQLTAKSAVQDPGSPRTRSVMVRPRVRSQAGPRTGSGGPSMPLEQLQGVDGRPSPTMTMLQGAKSRAFEKDPGGGFLPPICNGVDVEALVGCRVTKRGFALMLARLCPEKGVHFALQAAHAADISLLIGGAVFPYPEHLAYFDSEVRPLLDRRRRFLGPVGLARKRRLLAAARCLLAPSLAPETSSLVAMEALASGTPVIAFRAGALAEIVEHGRTGWLVENADEMAAAIARAAEIDPSACRAAARERFSQGRMVRAYFRLYDALARREAA
jgi:glycosyltransferase involved in cell wall biosynthesis